MPRVFLLSLLYRLAGAGTLFFTLLSLLVLVLYLLGNFQEFLDSSQLFLLKILQGSLLLAVALGCLHLVLIFLLGRQRKHWLRLLAGLFSLLLSYTFLLAFKYLSAWL